MFIVIFPPCYRRVMFIPVDTTMPVQRMWCIVLSLCSLWSVYFNCPTTIFYSAIFVHFINLLQKAGFLYLEESFSKDEPKFRRRV